MTTTPTIDAISNEVLALLSSDHEPPCLSLYQPTHRRHPDNHKDPILFRNLVKQLAALLRDKYPAADARRLLEPFEALAHDREFWNHTLDGLAVVGGPGVFGALRIPESVAELVVVADRFHTRPLRRFLQSGGRYHVLALSLDRMRLFEGNRDVLDELDLVAGVPATVTDALGEELTEPHQTVASYAGASGSQSPMHHGHGAKADEADVDARRFFRAVDRAVVEHYSKPSGLPLILAALPQHHDVFREVSHNPLLVAEGIETNPDSLSADELGVRAWEVFEPRYHARLASLCEEFERARSRDLGSDDLAEVARASTSGRVATLLLEAGRRIPGRIDGVAGRVELGPELDPHADDPLDEIDEIGEIVARQGGAVLVVPAKRMPSGTGLAAIYRY